MARGLKYSDFASKIDMERFYEAIDYEPVSSTRSGDDLGFCPDPWGLHKHGDQTGKFAINPEKRLANCWVCGGFSLLSLVMAIRSCDDDEATDWLYQFAVETEQSDESFLVELDEILRVVEREKLILPQFNEHVLDKWGRITDWPDDILDWVDGRGIDLITAKRFRLGYGVITKRAPKRNGEPIDDDYTGPAIVFPHYWRGRLVGWQHRWLEQLRPHWLAKYTNTTEFPKSYTIFNFDRAALRPDAPVVVESVPTTIFLESMGVSSVATFGSTVPDEQLRVLRRFQQGVILAPDNDKPGRKWLDNLTRHLERYIPVYELPPVLDPERPQDDETGGDLGDFAARPTELLRHLDLWE